MGHSRPLFHLFSSFRAVQLLKNLAASGIRTQIVRAVGKNADHYTTTTAQQLDPLPLANSPCVYSKFSAAVDK